MPQPADGLSFVYATGAQWYGKNYKYASEYYILHER